MIFFKMSVLLLFILATATAASNDIPPRVEDGIEVDPWSSDVEDKIETDMYWRRNLLLYRLLKLLQGNGDRYNVEDEPILKENVEQNMSELPDLKEADEKKWVTALSTNTGKSNKTPKSRPQPKWNSKKGKGTPMLCYFKLCSFRSPI
ncbi:uncharacterized protein LOC125068449 [Vanessa atalanta]|uniref:uncharacterized protein LOC125068449 n=1 Tax=Vanessa atalanta TaxID=42275 RepID=UPI001FCD070A|nr:uncharacterized protein LOC125068449 [Vanessa atalanta]